MGAQAPATPHTKSAGYAQARKTTVVTAKGCAGIGCLGLFIVVLIGLVLPDSKKVSKPRQPESAVQETGKSAPKERLLDAMKYDVGTKALEEGDYKTAEAHLRQVSPSYKDTAALLKRPELKKAAEERAAEEQRLRSLGVIYAKQQANVRSGPSTEHSVVRQAQAGETLQYESKQGEWYKLGTIGGGAQWIHESVVLTESEKRRRASADLQLLSWHWSTEYGWATAEGQVKNVSGRALENVEVVIQWKTSSGQFITSSDCLIDYNPILPGQTSPFDCSARENPAMNRASIDFKTLFGGTLTWYED